MIIAGLGGFSSLYGSASVKGEYRQKLCIGNVRRYAPVVA